MKFKQKMLTICCVPLVLLTAITLVLGLLQFQSGMYLEKKDSLKSCALAAMNLYGSQGYGDYERKADGDVWRGMNFDVSKETSLVDSMKEQTGVDITFFYQDTAVMTSICNEENRRWIGMEAGENIKDYTLGQGAQLWYRNIEIDGAMCHAYLIPVTQPGDGTVVGALMASVSTNELEDIFRRYILICAAVSLVILLAVGSVVFWYIGNLTKVLHNVRRVLLKVSSGDLTDERLAAAHRRDEFGELETGTEKLRIKIGSLLGDIQMGAEKLTDVAERLSVTSEQNVQAAKEMNTSVGQINVTANQQREGTESAEHDVDVTKGAIDQMLHQIDEVNRISMYMAELAGNSEGILKELLSSSRISQKTVEEISQQVMVTNDSVQQIKSVTDYITNIAEETNLLALNASIEAARAGDAGKGFAVVAQQIQKLAEESNNSASRIGENIQSLVQKTENIVRSIDGVDEALKMQEDNVEKTKNIFDELGKNIKMLTDKESEMQQNVSAMNQAKDNMSDIILELARAAEDNADISGNAVNVTDQMVKEIEGLALLTGDLTEMADKLDKNLESFLS